MPDTHDDIADVFNKHMNNLRETSLLLHKDLRAFGAALPRQAQNALHEIDAAIRDYLIAASCDFCNALATMHGEKSRYCEACSQVLAPAPDRSDALYEEAVGV